MTNGQHRITRAIAAAFILSCVCFLPVRAQQSLPADLDEYVARTLKEFNVPGLAIAVVKDGRVVIARGYGIREIGKPGRVDEHTLFGIASNSKAFTAAALAMLVDEGKLSWDDPVIKHLPAFQMADPYVTREMTVRDLLTFESCRAHYKHTTTASLVRELGSSINVFSAALQLADHLMRQEHSFARFSTADIDRVRRRAIPGT